MKKSRNLLILLIVLVLLGGAYAFVATRTPQGSSSGTDTQKIKLSVVDSKKITKMSLSSNDSSIEMDKNGDNWTLKSDPNIKLDQDDVNLVAGGLANVYANRVVDENPGDLDQYGLKTPVSTASAVYNDGGGITVLLGNKTPQGDGYYMMVKGDPKLYTIASQDGDYLKYTLTDVRYKKLTDMTSDKINLVNFTSGGKTIELKKIDGGLYGDLSSTIGSWILSKPYSREYPAKDEAGQSVALGMTGTIITKFVDDNPSDYSKYGLDKPVQEIQVTGTDGSFKVYIGKNADDNNLYFKTDGSKAVYTMDKGKLDPFSKAPLDYLDNVLFPFDINSVSQVTVESQGTKDVLSITGAAKPGANQGDSASLTQSFKINGKDVDANKAGDFYQKLVSLGVEAENDKNVAETPEVTITFEFNKGNLKQDVVTFSSYNQDFYAIFMGGKADLLISKTQLQSAIDLLGELKK